MMMYIFCMKYILRVMPISLDTDNMLLLFPVAFQDGNQDLPIKLTFPQESLNLDI